MKYFYKRFLKLGSILFLSWLCVANVMAQSQTISGKVTDAENGEGLPGVTVQVKGTTTGTVTDVDGNYSLSVPNTSGVLVVSFVGYVVQEVPINNRTSISVQLEPDVEQLDAVVVVGYGTQKKQNVTGAVSSVDFDDKAMTSRATTNVSTMLSGLSSGIRVQQSSGIPRDNAESNISIRGIGSLNASQSPLVLVDGMVADINTVSPHDVASVSILKDAASAAIYGSRASNGVILITTKSGKNSGGKVNFNYNNFVGFRKPTIMHDVISNTADHMQLINIAQINSGVNPSFTEEQIAEWREKSQTDPIGYPNTDWSDVLIKQNVVTNHNFSARGGNEKVNFYTSLDYFKDDGLITNTGFRRMNFRNNLTYQVNDWLKLGNNFTVITSKAEPTQIANIFTWWRATTPGMVPKHPDGRYGAAQTPSGEAGANNLLMQAESIRGEHKSNNLQGKIFATITPLKGWEITGSYFADIRNQENWIGGDPQERWNFQTESIVIPKGDVRLQLTETFNRNQREIIDIFSSFNRSFGKHAVGVLGGFNQEYFFQRGFSASKRDLLSWDVPVLDAAPSDPQASGNASDFAMRSFFGRLNYAFSNKYLFEANARYDGSSRFAPDRRWGFFPSVSAGWVVSEENFFGGLRNTVSSLKLRASYGQLGNNGIGNYEWQEFYGTANYALGDRIAPGLLYGAFGNDQITWESTNVLNVGLDAILFESLSVDVNYYEKNTNNILANLPIPQVNGGIAAPRFNSAEVMNKGVETEVRYYKTIGKLGVSLGANFAYNKNEIVSYKGDFIEGRGASQAWTEGYPIGTYWVREVETIVQNQSQIDELIAQGYTFHPSAPGPGDFLYRDANGDKVINDDDRVLKGNPIPLITYGGSIGLNYAGFDFNMIIDGVGKWDKYLQGDLYGTNRITIGYLWPEAYKGMWTEENPSTTLPKMYTNNPKNNMTSDFFLHSAAFTRIRSMQLGYTLPNSLLSKARLQNLRVFGNLENYFTFTDWPGQDPETDDITYPLSKTVSFGLSVGF
ncbi:TonB-dependent receptor plug [Flammeovirgaceae bacterium 311]|nr:TonB-dependent receptor plug [Flammeovirgaceae bacterium 311]